MSAFRWIQLEPTTRCNLRCEFCYGRSMPAAEMDLEAFRAVLALFPGLLFLQLQGEAEPFLAKRFFEMVAEAASKNILITTTTNGTLLAPSRADAIVDSKVASIQISLESPDPDEFRELRGFSLEKLVRGIEALQAEKARRGSRTPALGFAVTVFRSTRHRLRQTFELHRELGMDGMINVRYLQKTPGYERIYGPELRDELLGDAEVAAVAAEEQALLQEFFGGPLPPNHPVSERLVELQHKMLRAGPGCFWLDSGLYVDADGELGPCCNIKKDVFRFGHHRDVSLSEVRRTRDEMQRELLRGEIPDACAGCMLAESIQRRVKGETQCLPG
jgi:MoaA/NifB/PqqE/SkfB family radical SAM enzyme